MTERLGELSWSQCPTRIGDRARQKKVDPLPDSPPLPLDAAKTACLEGMKLKALL